MVMPPVYHTINLLQIKYYFPRRRVRVVKNNIVRTLFANMGWALALFDVDFGTTVMFELFVFHAGPFPFSGQFTA